MDLDSCFQIRLYDPKRQRRPTISFEWEDSPLTRISAVPSSNGYDMIALFVELHGSLFLFHFYSPCDIIHPFAFFH